MTHSFPTRRSSDLIELNQRLWQVQQGVVIFSINDQCFEVGWPILYWWLKESVNVEGIKSARKHDFIMVIVTENRSEEHTSELQSLMRISYAVFCLKKKKTVTQPTAVQHTNS